MRQLWFNFDGGKDDPIVIACNDNNRELMIKYKYDKITPDELNELHNRIERLIYKVIRKNYLMMDIRDIYQEIWRRIIRSKHTWNEHKGTMVSTWIVVVAQSVINTLRSKKNRYLSRCMRYEDLPDFTEGSISGEDRAVFFNPDLRDDFYRMEDSKMRIKDFLAGLSKSEREIVDIILTSGYDELNKNNTSRYMKSKITKKFIGEKSGLADGELRLILDELQKKFRSQFEDVED